MGQRSDQQTGSESKTERIAEANRLITESQELFAQQKSAEAIQRLRQAYELDKNNSLARTILANALVEHAYSMVETDWWEAETLANEALALNPAHPTARTVHSRILEQKTSGSIEEWVSQTRKLQSAGNLPAALSQIAEAFAVYPREPRLLQIQDAIQRDHSVQRRQARRRDLEDLRRAANEIDTLADDASKKAFAGRIQAVAARYSTDGEILSVANAILHRLGLQEVSQKRSTASPRSIDATAIHHGSAADASDASVAAVSSVPPIPVTPIPIPPNPIAAANAPASIVPPIPVAPEPQLRRSQAVITPAAETAAPAAELISQTSQPTSRLKPPARSNHSTLILVSAAAIILVTAIFFFARKHHSPPPVAQAPAAAAPVPAAAVATPASATPTTPPSEASPASLPAPQVSSDTVAAKVASGDQLPAVRSAHALDTLIDSGHEVGTLLVITGEDNARVFLNGEAQPQLTQAGQLRLPNLELKDYVVQVSKSGFLDPPQQTIRIRQGEPARLIFNLQPNIQSQPRLASLTVEGGAPGTTVLVDQNVVGVIQADGGLSVSTVNPGDHTVELRKERFKPRQFRKHFDAGGAISLAGAETALEAAPDATLAELKITFTPADAKVALVKTGGLPTTVSSGVPVNLAAGVYTLTARTAESFTRSSTIEVVGGQSRTLDLSLSPTGMSKWDDPGAWKHEGDSFTRKGGDFVLYGVVPTSGTFVFSAMLNKGRILQWVVNYADPKNYVLFQMDDNNFYRMVIRNGQKTDEIIVPDKGDKKSFRMLHIRVSPTEIVHQIRHGDSWRVLDRWTQPAPNLSLGKFGFYIPGSDQVALAGFAHYADLNTR